MAYKYTENGEDKVFIRIFNDRDGNQHKLIEDHGGFWWQECEEHFDCDKCPHCHEIEGPEDLIISVCDLSDLAANGEPIDSYWEDAH